MSDSGAQYDNPNRQVLGLDPIWHGADETDAPTDPADEGPFDPADHTIAEVQAFIDANPDLVQAVYDAESEGKARSTLLDWLTDKG